ncbi:MAG: hypothetical protein V8S93_00200, partial [Lachnospiraceae bacterium]
REKMQSSDEIIKEKTGFRKNKREITKGERKSKREQDLNVFNIRTNVKYWRKNRKWMRNTIRNFPTLYPGGENITKISFILVGK